MRGDLVCGGLARGGDDGDVWALKEDGGDGVADACV